MRSINEMIVHCSATPEGRHVTVGTIRKWHKDRGWSDIGYHYVIYLDGSIHAGRSVSKIGAHVKGHNRGTVGICYVGGMDKGMKKPKDTRTPAQKSSLLSLIHQLKAAHPTITKVSGHNQYAAKACPSFNAQKEYMDVFKPPVLADVPKPAPIKKRVIKDAAIDRVSKEKIGSILTGAGGAAAAAKEATDIIESSSTLKDSVVSAGPWILLGVMCIAIGIFLWKKRDERMKEARQEIFSDQSGS